MRPDGAGRRVEAAALLPKRRIRLAEGALQPVLLVAQPNQFLPVPARLRRVGKQPQILGGRRPIRPVDQVTLDPALAPDGPVRLGKRRPEPLLLVREVPDLATVPAVILPRRLQGATGFLDRLGITGRPVVKGPKLPLDLFQALRIAPRLGLRFSEFLLKPLDGRRRLLDVLSDLGQCPEAAEAALQFTERDADAIEGRPGLAGLLLRTFLLLIELLEGGGDPLQRGRRLVAGPDDQFDITAGNHQLFSILSSVSRKARFAFLDMTPATACCVRAARWARSRACRRSMREPSSISIPMGYFRADG